MTFPATSERNFTPSSTALSGPPSTTAGTALAGQIVTGALDATVMLNAFVDGLRGMLESVARTVKL